MKQYDGVTYAKPPTEKEQKGIGACDKWEGQLEKK